MISITQDRRNSINLITEEKLKQKIMDRWKDGPLSKSIDSILEDVLKENINEDPSLTKKRVHEVFVKLFLHG